MSSKKLYECILPLEIHECTFSTFVANVEYYNYLCIYFYADSVV